MSPARPGSTRFAVEVLNASTAEIAAGGKILKRDRTGFRREDFAAVVGRRVIAPVEAAKEHPAGFAAIALDLHAGDARGGIGNGDVGQLADVFGDHRVEHAECCSS